jgi:hypothetical protein
MFYTVAQVSELTNLSKVSIYNRLKTKEFKKHMTKKQGITYIDEDGLNLIKDDLIFKDDQFKGIEEEPQQQAYREDSKQDNTTLEEDLLKQNKDLINALLKQLEEKDIQLKEKDKQISEKDIQIMGLQKLIENSQVLLREEQQQNNNQLQLEEHIKQLDNRLDDVREKMDQRKEENEKKGFFKRRAKK